MSRKLMRSGFIFPVQIDFSINMVLSRSESTCVYRKPLTTVLQCIYNIYNAFFLQIATQYAIIIIYCDITVALSDGNRISCMQG